VASREKPRRSFSASLSILIEAHSATKDTGETFQLDSQQKELVQSSFANVVPISSAAADLFYGRLFELDPDLKPLFKSDLTEQKKKLMQMLAAAVNGLDDLDSLVPIVRDLGVRHVAYGVQDTHYDTVGAALLWTLEQGLGEAFTPATRKAWTEVYGLLSSTMKDAARSAAPASA
jgi:hemoglobin-like flavoprotein